MKLLFCPECHDLFKLPMKRLKRCSCGKVCGKYIDNTNAEVNGEGYSLAIGNGSLLIAIAKGAALPRSERRPGKSSVICWVRPHEGEANPHTKINPKLGKKKK